MQHQGDYNSITTTPPYYYPLNPNPNPIPTTDYHHYQPPPYASAPPFTPTTSSYHPQPPPPPHPTAPPSNPNQINNFAQFDSPYQPHSQTVPYINNISSCNNINNNKLAYDDDDDDDDDQLNFPPPPPPPQKWILGMSGGSGGGSKEQAVPKVDANVQKFRVKWLAEIDGQSTMDVLCQIGLNGILIRDPSTSRTLKKYPLDTITRCEVYDSSTFAFWFKRSVDMKPRRIRLQSNSYTTNTLLDTVTAATIRVKEMGGRSSPVDNVEVTEQSTEKEKGLGDGMNIIKPPDEEKYHLVPYEAVTKCTGCGGDFSALKRKHHCGMCGDVLCVKCTHGIIALTSEDNAPRVRGDIKCRCDNVRRHNYSRLCFAQGQSKSSAKRRARHLGRCFKCGNFSHDGECPKNQDNEFLKLCLVGPVRCYTERLLHPRGYAHARMISELDRLTEKAKRLGFQL